MGIPSQIPKPHLPCSALTCCLHPSWSCRSLPAQPPSARRCFVVLPKALRLCCSPQSFCFPPVPGQHPTRAVGTAKLRVQPHASQESWRKESGRISSDRTLSPSWKPTTLYQDLARRLLLAAKIATACFCTHPDMSVRQVLALSPGNMCSHWCPGRSPGNPPHHRCHKNLGHNESIVNTNH